MRRKIRHLFKRNHIAAVHDTLMAAISFPLALYIRLGDEQWYRTHDYIGFGTFLFTIVCLTVFVSMRLYRGLWRFASMRDLIAIIKAVSLSVLIFAVLMALLNRLENVPRSVFFINWMLLLGMLGGPRFIYRAIKERRFSWRATIDKNKIPVLLVGAGTNAEQFIRDLARDGEAPFEVVGIADDNPQQKGRTIHNVHIYGNSEALPGIIDTLERKNRRPQKIIVADEKTAGTAMRRLLDIAENLGIPLARLPSLSELKHGVSDKQQVRDIAVEDLLSRPQNVLEREVMQQFVEGHRILLTGAGGTIGSELARQIASYRPAELVLFELSEFNLYQIEREIRGRFPELRLSATLGDVRDGRHVEAVFAGHSPELVFHAAAVKHVPLAEDNVEETVLTNVFGTRHIAEACQRHGARAMVMISTDKAVNPSNVMGATKRLAESFCQAMGDEKKNRTRFITVRFGNVLGSTGSVVPLFREQLEKGGPITVTHPDITRYFMTVREAVELVLQAATMGVALAERKECIFVLDMGQPVKILDLALQMIRLAGLKPHEDIEIRYTGLRPGEKLYEELFHFSENAAKTAHASIYLASPRTADMANLRKGMETLLTACNDRRASEAVVMLKKLVPEFKHAVS